jgi:hypothetical protein
MELSSSSSFLKYPASCSCFPGALKTPANRSGKTHIAESLSATADLGLKPTSERSNMKQLCNKKIHREKNVTFNS